MEPTETTSSKNASRALIAAYVLDQHGHGTAVDWDGIAAWCPEQGLLWVHLDYTFPEAQQWLRETSGLDTVACEALLAEETRPRSVVFQDELLLQLRGVNLNPGADPEDMVAIRLWSDGNRIVSTRRRRLLSVSDMCQAIETGRGPCSCGEFVVDLADRLAERMATVIDGINDSVDELEEQVMTLKSHELRTRIASLRREAITLRRYLSPQREAMTRLYGERVSWIDELERLRLREVADRTTRYVEDLDSVRERATVVQEELMSGLSEQMDRRMYVLSIVAALFLPLGFLTGLLGINVGGIPGAENHYAFLAFALALAVLLVIQLLIFRWKRWF